MDVLNGSTDDLELLPLVFQPPPKADLDSPAVWAAVNPAYGTIIDPISFENELRQAKRVPSEWAYFKRVSLNIWTFDDSKWIPIHEFDACRPEGEKDWGRERQLEWFIGKDATLAIDLADKADLVALALAARDGGRVRLFTTYLMPIQTAQERGEADRIPYPDHIANGWMIGTDTRTTDYHAIEVQVRRLRDLGVKLSVVGFDAHNARQLLQDLSSAGFNAVAVGQTIASYTGPTKDYRDRILNRTIVHDGNPVTRYCLSNTVVETDALGNIRPSKNKSRKGRIDGTVASIMALGLLDLPPAPTGAFYPG